MRWLLGAVVGASWIVLPACGDTTNNYASCGPGTRLDPDLNACVPVDADGGQSGTGGVGGGSPGGTGGGGEAGSGAGDTGGGGAGAGASGGGGDGEVAGAAGEASDAGADAKPEPHPDDDECLDSVVYLVNGDKACGTYNPAGVCSGTESEVIELDPLAEADVTPSDPWDPSTGGVWVRTPSRPGTNLACEGCSRPGSVAQIRIPIRTTAEYSFPIYIAHVDAENDMAPWYISHERVGEYCQTDIHGSCWVSDAEQQDVLFETDDPNAPARNFHIYYYPYLGVCNASDD